MTTYDPAMHHRQSIRLKAYDYAQPGAYFVTIVCQNRLCLLDPEPVRRMVHSWWNKLPNKFLNLATDTFVIMPNHIHGIVVIDGPWGAEIADTVEVHPGVHRPEPEREPTPGSATLGHIVQWFKTMTTNAYIRCARREGWKPFPGRLWQRNYYERVIRNQRELDAIRQYIRDNPLNWTQDVENPDRVVDTHT